MSIHFDLDANAFQLRNVKNANVDWPKVIVSKVNE